MTTLPLPPGESRQEAAWERVREEVVDDLSRLEDSDDPLVAHLAFLILSRSHGAVSLADLVDWAVDRRAYEEEEKRENRDPS